MLLAGTAEAGTTISIREGATLVTTAIAEVDGTFIVSLLFGPGPHAVTAQARDAAGNVSAASPPRSFTVNIPSPAMPLVSVGGDFQLTAVRDAPDPFLPVQGEVNTVTIDGTVLKAPGAQGNHVWQAAVRRQIVQKSTGAVVATVDAAAPIVVGPSNQSMLFALSNGWNGQLAPGSLAPPGAYESRLTVWIVRDPLGPIPPVGTPPTPGGCGPAAQPVSGPCKFDKLELLNTFGILSRPPPNPPPFNCGSLVEACDGQDNNCNGQIDEGIACDVGATQTCPCVPRGCNGATCGTLPDGCGGTVTCGGACP